MARTTTLPLSEAKAGLSAVVKDVGETGARYVITVRDRPSAMLVPIPKPVPDRLKGYGALAGMRPRATREDEKAAWAEAMEEKHAQAAGR